MAVSAHITPGWTTGETEVWVYVLGERAGVDVKVGHTDRPTVRQRLNGVNNAQTASEGYELLAAVLGTRAAEDALMREFEPYRRKDKGRRREYFYSADEIVDWVVWLRQQWWTCFDPDVVQSDWEEQHHSHWLPAPGRVASRPTPDPSKLIQDYEQLTGPLAGTAWSWLPDPRVSFQDYFTEPDLVARAVQAMGSIDLDAASHWVANRRLHQAGVEVGDYFHVNRSAFDHDWVGNVWLNPPYGENERWFARALEMQDRGLVKQLCMLSPVYAFTTAVASEALGRAAAAVLLTPTPKFYNPADASRTGTNLPHAIFYWGHRVDEFMTAYREIGIPFRVEWSELAVGSLRVTT